MPTPDWLDREAAFRNANRVPTRVLRPHAAGHTFGDGRDNRLVQGDNLEALKALLPFYRGQAKCIFIDPPHNTGSDFEHQDDNLEHAKWLRMMLPRLQLLREFLREDGRESQRAPGAEPDQAIRATAPVRRFRQSSFAGS